jgi:hypothetical protein
VGRGLTAGGRTQHAVILSEAKNLSSIDVQANNREILRFAQNDKTNYFFYGLFSRDIAT